MPRPKVTDPRRLGGDIAGPGGPHDEDAVVIDTRNAVLLDSTNVALVGAIRPGASEQAIALKLAGRINKTSDRAEILYLLNEDGAAALVSELVGVAQRAGFGKQFVERLVERLDELP